MDKANHQGHSDIISPTRPLLIILSGPSGVGKDAVLHKMKESSFPLTYVVTMTTRPRREREENNVDYKFVSMDEFHGMVEKGELLEWANVYGNMYGVPRNEVDQALKNGRDVIVKVDIQGAANIKRIMPDAISIFLIPSSMEDLSIRLTQRHTESPSALELRLKKAAEEMEELPKFDYSVVNQRGEIDRAVSEIKTIISAEKNRVRSS